MSRRPRHPPATAVAALTAVVALMAVVAVLVIVLGAVAGTDRSHGRAGRGLAAHASASGAGAGAGAGARRVGPITHGTIGFALTLRLREQNLDAYLSHVTPGPDGLDAAQFGNRFGLSGAQLARLRSLLQQSGITVTQVYPQRTAMLVRADVVDLHRLFGLRLRRYVTSAGERYFAAEHAPRIPPTLTPYITGLGDLSNIPINADDIPASGLTPALTATAYDITPLWDHGDTGRGQTIAVATVAGAPPDTGVINPADLRAFTPLNRGIPPDVEIRKVDGGSAYASATGSDRETDLDLQVIGGVAPGATIIDYQSSARSSLGHSLADVYNAIEQDGKAKVVSTSYGVCEQLLATADPGDQALIDNSLKALDASGVTVFVASGDSGAYACLQAAQVEPHSEVPSIYLPLSVQTPASSPFVISVGGTRLELRSNGQYLGETAWSDPLEREGGGGGLSAVEPRPVWQQGPGVLDAGANPKGLRQLPDVAGPADPGSGFAICGTPGGGSTPQCGPGNGGTSAAAPFWAASLLLVQQYAAQHGAGKLATCFAGPILYDLAASHQPVAPFHQVDFGNNGYYPAKPGWNYATGLGTPDVFNLAQDYASFLHQRSSRTCPF